MPLLDKKLLCLTLGQDAGVYVHDGLLHGWQVHYAASLAEASEALQSQTMSVGLLVLCRPNHQTIEQVDSWLGPAFTLPWVLLLTAESLSERSMQTLILQYFFDYHTFPVDATRLHYALGHVLGFARLQQQFQLRIPAASDEELVGQSLAMQRLRQQIKKVAAVDAPVLISGESGSGKELTARAIHQGSRRVAGPFVAVNCGAIPAGLVQSELFGHERGAFTGATKERRGWIESADQGTLFLDEIADLPLDQQVNLLRFLQEGTILRLGASRPVQVNVRVVAASHTQLDDAVRAGRFREDLMYRLNVVPLRVPALRERREDIPVLAAHFFKVFSPEKNHRLSGWSDAALQVMQAYDWPGNVRECMNRIRRAMVMAEGRLITPLDLGLDAVLRAPSQEADDEALQQVRSRAEHDVIVQAWHKRGKNVSHAARDLGISRMTLYRLLDKHQLKPKRCA
jgi:DNA-binding NtrC family response regulator